MICARKILFPILGETNARLLSPVSYICKKNNYVCCFVAQMSDVTVGLSNDDPETTAPVYQENYHFVQYNGNLPASETASVTFPSTGDSYYRYVIIQLLLAAVQPMCLAEVKVFLRGTPTFYVLLLIVQITCIG